MLVPLSSSNVTTVGVDVGGQEKIEGGLKAVRKFHWCVVDTSDNLSLRSKVEINEPSFATGLFDSSSLAISRLLMAWSSSFDIPSMLSYSISLVLYLCTLSSISARMSYRDCRGWDLPKTSRRPRPLHSHTLARPRDQRRTSRE